MQSNIDGGHGDRKGSKTPQSCLGWAGYTQEQRKGEL